VVGHSAVTHTDGFQIGIEAKLLCNRLVLSQALERNRFQVCAISRRNPRLCRDRGRRREVDAEHPSPLAEQGGMTKRIFPSRQALAAERVRHLFDYDPAVGNLVWKNPPKKNARLVGKIAGTKHAKGYIQIGIDGQFYLAHLVVWLHHYGEWPNDQIDHEDRDKSNNRIANLRDANNSQNNANVGAKGGIVGLKGVTLSRNGRFVAQLHHNRKHYHLGTFETAEEAHARYVERAHEIFGEFATVA
jgi:hypothetical protein